MTKHDSWAKFVEATQFSFKGRSIPRQSFAFISLGGFYEGLKDGSLSEMPGEVIREPAVSLDLASVSQFFSSLLKVHRTVVSSRHTAILSCRVDKETFCSSRKSFSLVISWPIDIELYY